MHAHQNLLENNKNYQNLVYNFMGTLLCPKRFSEQDDCQKMGCFVFFCLMDLLNVDNTKVAHITVLN